MSDDTAEARVDTDAVDVLLDALQRVAQMWTCPACHATGVTQAHKRDCFVLDAINRAKAALTPPASEPRVTKAELDAYIDGRNDQARYAWRRNVLDLDSADAVERLARALVTQHGGPAPWPGAKTSHAFARDLIAALRSDAAEREGE